MIRKGFMWLVIAFLVFFLITQPVQAAGVVKGIGSALANGANQLAQFVSSLA